MLRKREDITSAYIIKKDAFARAGIQVAGSPRKPIVVDATPGGVGEGNKALYEKYQKKAIWEGGEEHELAGFSFNASCNEEKYAGQPWFAGEEIPETSNADPSMRSC